MLEMEIVPNMVAKAARTRRKVLRATMLAFLALYPGTRQWAEDYIQGDVVTEVSANVFEVVVRKSDTDPLTYAERLPIELLPYAERTDKYLSVGTAFALKDGGFVSAAHVFAPHYETLRTDYALRDASGKVHPIGRVTAYSYWRDYICFEVAGLTAPGLAVRDDPPINSRIFSIGNALGDGVVIRDGVLTSTTPEDWKGSWKWLRFSAPASPGNSGGPLVDERGRVLGLVLRKSENENLNFALPISEIIRDSTGYLDLRETYQVPNIARSVLVELHVSIPLPLGLEELRKDLSTRLSDAYADATRRVVSEAPQAIFPEAPDSESLFGDLYWRPVPSLLVQQANGRWELKNPENAGSARIGKDGGLSWGGLLNYTFMRYATPKGQAVSDLIASPRKLMEAVLSGYALSRKVAGKDIRILSMGDPAGTTSWRDRWGRRWFLSTWNVPQFDLSFLLFWTATPDGAAVVYRQSSYGARGEYAADFKIMSDFITFSYQGKLNQWRDFLSLKDDLPKGLAQWRLDFQEGKRIKLDTPRFSLVPDASAMDVRGDGIFLVQSSWFREPSGVVWDVAMMRYNSPDDDYQSNTWYKVVRPVEEASESTKTLWKRIAERSYPYNGQALLSDGNTNVYYSLSRARGDGEPAFRFLAQAYYKGKVDSVKAETRAKAAALSFIPTRSEEALAAGFGETTGTLPDYRHLDGRSIFDAVDQGDRALLARFIQVRWDLCARDAYGDTPLLSAIKASRTDLATDLVAVGAATDLADSQGNTPLMLAVQAGQDGVTEALIAGKADAGSLNNWGESALILALRSGRERAALRLLDVPLAIVGITKDGWTPLLTALRWGSDTVARAIVSKTVGSASWKGTATDGWTVLHLAARYHPDLVPDLIARDCDGVNLRTESGATPLLLAADRGSSVAVKALLKAGADPTMADGDGWTPLMAALRTDSADAVRLLLGAAKPGEGKTKEGWTAFHVAARYAPDLFGLLADAAGMDAEGKAIAFATASGYRPLHLAVSAHDRHLTRYLLERGADQSVVTTDGKTALDLARESGDEALVALFDAGTATPRN